MAANQNERPKVNSASTRRARLRGLVERVARVKEWEGNEACRLMEECWLPLAEPFEDTISDNTLLVAAICNYVESSTCSVLRACSPCPLSGEPGPPINYPKLRQFILSTRGKMAQGDFNVFEKLGTLRRRYFSSYQLFFTVDRTARDLYAEQLQLRTKPKKLIRNSNSPTDELDEIHRRIGINAEASRKEKTRYKVCAHAVREYTTQLSEIKHTAIELCEKFFPTPTSRQMMNKLNFTSVISATAPVTPPRDEKLIKRKRDVDDNDSRKINKMPKLRN